MQRQRSVGAEGHGGALHPIFVLDGLERSERIALRGPLAGKFGARDQIIDRFEHAIETVINGIDIARHRNALAARQLRGFFDRRRIVTVDVQHPRAGDFFERDAFGLQAQAIGTAPENGALTGGLIDDDVRRLIGTIFANFDVVEIDAGFAQAVHLHAAAFIVADGADVFNAQPELRDGGQTRWRPGRRD